MFEKSQNNLTTHGIDPTSWEGTLQMLDVISAEDKENPIASRENRQIIQELIETSKPAHSRASHQEGGTQTDWQAVRRDLIDIRSEDPNNPIASEENFQIINELMEQRP